MTDPLLGPPGRPDHPDFWRMADAVLQGDADSELTREQFHGRMDGMVDAESLIYVADQRVQRLVIQVAAMLREEPGPTSMHESLMTLWIDGFVAGLRFHQAGGHRDR